MEAEVEVEAEVEAEAEVEVVAQEAVHQPVQVSSHQATRG